jgi:hypothetical protein
VVHSLALRVLRRHPEEPRKRRLEGWAAFLLSFEARKCSHPRMTTTSKTRTPVASLSA